tara:strand:- start:115 stop:372 length:258 start_codon:yes stop_codon:yes gene_type:complete
MIRFKARFQVDAILKDIKKNKMIDLKTRIEKLDPHDVAELMEFNKNDVSFGNSGKVREMLNEKLLAKFENNQIDEIDLIIIESGM